jgi:hypothetical protein
MKRLKKIKFLGLTLFLLVINTYVNAQDSLLTDSNGNSLPEVLLNRISIQFDDVPFLDALHEFETKGYIHLNYNEDIIPKNQKITVNISKRPVIIALREILRENSIDIVVTGSGQIVLVKIDPEETETVKKKYTISGFISDADDGEALIGTNIFINELGAGVVTNAYGFYSITIPEGYYSIKYSYMGYKTDEIFSGLFRNLNLNVELSKKTLTLDTILVTADSEDFLNSTEMSIIQLTPEKLENVPFLLGEKDILRTLHLLPGVTFGQDGDCGIYVRGGDQDQNLTLIDEAPVYNAFHSFGFFSVFNSDAVKSVKLYKGAAPPKYGGRISSILDIKMNEGNLKEFNGVAGLGLIFSRFTLQGPIIKDKSSFIISGRRTYIDLFKVFSSSRDVEDSDLYFYDLNLKANYRLSNNDRFYLSGYMGRDGFGFSDIFNVDWGNITSTLRWNHLFNNKLFLNSSLIYSHFNHNTTINSEDEDDEVVELISKVDDITLKEDFEYFIDANNTINFGLNYIYHNFLPGSMSATGPDPFHFILGKRSAHEFSLYISHEYSVNKKSKIDYGLRTTLFSVEGLEDIITISDIEEKPFLGFHKDEKTNYWRFEPRIAYTHRLDNRSTVKADFSMSHQYLHKLSNSNSGSPIDVWQPSSSIVKPQSANQFSLGYYRNFGLDEYEFSIEAYYKYMNNMIDYKEGAHLFFRNYFESELVFGEGRAYGIELFLKKKYGDFTGWVGYTLSKSEREFPDINNGEPFPAKFDRTHDFSVVASYSISDDWTISANMIYTTGHNVTIPYGKYIIDNRTINAYSSRNGYRLPPYHRLDIGISYVNDSGGTWNLSLYNVYAHKNTYTIQIRESDTNLGMREAVRLSLFSIVPSISYTFKF